MCFYIEKKEVNILDYIKTRNIYSSFIAFQLLA